MNEQSNSLFPAGISLRRAALISGFGLLLMTLFSIFSEFVVRQGLVVPGDAVATFDNIKASEALFRAGIGGYLIIIVLDIVVAWSLYLFLRPADRNTSLLTAWFRLVYSVIFGISLYNLVAVLNLVRPADLPIPFGSDELPARVMMSLNAFNDGWEVGFIFFGLHLALLGYLAFRSGYVPRIIAILLLLAGLGYLYDYLGKFMVSDFSFSVGLVTGWGELIFMFWLLIRGGKVPALEN